MSHDTVAQMSGTKDLKTEIVRIRARMANTLDALQRKLDPELLSNQVKQTVGGITDHAKEQAVEAVQQITDHPKERAMEAIGAANQMVDHAKAEALDTVKQSTDHVAAVGLGWLFFSGSSNGNGHYNCRNSHPHSAAPHYDRYMPNVPAQQGGIAGLVDQAKEVVGQVAETVQEKVGQVTDQAGTHAGNLTDQASNQVNKLSDQASNQVSWLSDQAGEWAGQAQTQADWTRTRASDLLRNSPLAVGLAVGLALPGTEPEHRLMGEARDNLLERAASAAKDTVEKVQQVATDATRAVGNEMRTQGIAS